jgi:hypothetical protein
MSTVFVSYRRQTAAGEARAVFKDLVAAGPVLAQFITKLSKVPLARM